MKQLARYKVFQFRHGWRPERGTYTCESPEAALAAEGRVLEITDNVKEIVRTELKLIPNPPSKRGRLHRFTHTLARFEREQPNTLFVCVIEEEEFRRLGAIADNTLEQREKETRQRIDNQIANSEEITFDLLPANWRKNIWTNKVGCWIWLTKEKQAPYRKVYAHLRGPIPEGAMLLHQCDNPHCVNPNHLKPGTARDNNKDMLERQRHWRQMEANAKKQRREQRLRRKATLKKQETDT